MMGFVVGWPDRFTVIKELEKQIEALKGLMKGLGTILAWEELGGVMLIVHTLDLDTQEDA